MSDMVERVARAIKALDPYVLGMPSYDVQFASMASAAIAAMREPTEGMLDVACEQTVEPDLYRIDAAEQWRAMIDAALAD